MVQITFKMKTTLRWWVIPLVKYSVVWDMLTRREEVSPAFIDWVVRHGLKIELE